MTFPLTPEQIQEFGLERYIEVLEQFVIEVREALYGDQMASSMDVDLTRALDRLDGSTS